MNILIADDHDLYREALAILVKRHFPNANITQSGDFVDLVQQSKHLDWAAFIIDLNMPNGDFYSAIQKLKLSHANTPIIIISASEETADTQSALQLGALGYITKSMRNEEIGHALELMLNRGISIHPVPAKTAVADKPHELTPRQLEVLRRMGEGASNKRIALDMGLSESTVKIHVRAILANLSVTNRTEAVLKAKANAIIE